MVGLYKGGKGEKRVFLFFFFFFLEIKQKGVGKVFGIA
jgi:hypothetical protein